jgi:hypothetical protein
MSYALAQMAILFEPASEAEGGPVRKDPAGETAEQAVR